MLMATLKPSMKPMPVVLCPATAAPAHWASCSSESKMDYTRILDLVTGLGYRLAMCGAETYRVEESINRILQSYGLISEVFVIPNCMHICLHTPDNQTLTRMRRIGQHGNDLDAVERYTGLSRRICKETPDPAIAKKWLKETDAQRKAELEQIAAICRHVPAKPARTFREAIQCFWFQILFQPGSSPDSVEPDRLRRIFLWAICYSFAGIVLQVPIDFMAPVTVSLEKCNRWNVSSSTRSLHL